MIPGDSRYPTSAASGICMILNYLVAKFDNLVAKSTTDNIHIMIAGKNLGRQIGHQRLKVSRYRLTDGRQMHLGDRIFPGQPCRLPLWGVCVYLDVSDAVQK